MSTKKDHLRRWITGAVGIAVVLGVVGYGSKPIFFLFVLVLLSFVLYEYYVLVGCRGLQRYAGVGLGLVMTVGFFFLGNSSFLGLLAGIMIVVCLLFLIAFQRGDEPMTVTGRYLVGLLVIAFLLGHVLWLRDLDSGRAWIFYLCAVIFAGDTCALYGGTFFGRHRLAPSISPGKTTEGAIAGLAGSCLAGLLVGRWGIPGFELTTFFFLSIALGIAGQMGDLWESALKRQAKVKDSGGLLPGHGGFLDRLDSMLFSAPLLYYAVLFLQDVP
jgi:phosphatidate cytidylyltransferase